MLKPIPLKAFSCGTVRLEYQSELRVGAALHCASAWHPEYAPPPAGSGGDHSWHPVWHPLVPSQVPERAQP